MLLRLVLALLVIELGGHFGSSDKTEITSELSLERVVAPFEILGPDGHPYALPFAGGLDVPRPQFVDIDGDTDLDLFIQEYSNQLWYFENTGSAKAPRYEWRTNKFQNIDIGEWYRFVDVDADALIDLICEKPFSNIQFYRNTGTKSAAKLEFVDVLRDIEEQPVFMDRQNIPWLVDVDCDKRLDLFVGRVEGTLARFEADAPGSIYFEFITENFEGIEIIARVGDDPARPTARHGANAIAFGDFEGDGDQDLFWGDFFEPGVLLIENIGATCSTPNFQVEPVHLPWAAEQMTSGYNAPMPVDIDLDGDLDMFIGVMGGAFNPVGTSAQNLFFWERTAPDAFELRTKKYLDMLDLGSDTAPALGDLDGDGDLDLLVGTKLDPVAADSGRMTTFVNVGTATAPRFRQGNSIPLGEAYHIAPALGDLDADGDLDMLVGTWNTNVQYYRNDGTSTAPRWVHVPEAEIVPERASNIIPTLVDIDGDKDLDLFIGSANGVVGFYRNTGTPAAPTFTLVTDRLENVKAGRRGAPAFLDVDGDGRLDLLLGQEASEVLVYRNTGTAKDPAFAPYTGLPLELPHMGTPAVADLDGDGRPDLVAGTVSGGLVFLKGR